jgi:hypothetical protein
LELDPSGLGSGGVLLSCVASCNQTRAQSEIASIRMLKSSLSLVQARISYKYNSITFAQPTRKGVPKLGRAKYEGQGWNPALPPDYAVVSICYSNKAKQMPELLSMGPCQCDASPVPVAHPPYSKSSVAEDMIHVEEGVCDAKEA